LICWLGYHVRRETLRRSQVARVRAVLAGKTSVAGSAYGEGPGTGLNVGLMRARPAAKAPYSPQVPHNPLVTNRSEP
jgi:hypothetical protein